MLIGAAAIVFVAGILRGMTGFGFALVAVMGLGQLWPHTVTTPTVLLIELVLTAVLIGDGILPHLDGRRLVPLALGGLAGTLFGALGVGALPPGTVKPLLDATILVSALVSLAHPVAPSLDRTPVAAAIGFLVGTLAAAFAVGGPFVVVWFLAVGAPPAVIRANLVLFFGIIDIAAVVVRQATVGIPPEAVWNALILLVPAAAGAFLGGSLFRKVDAAWWRRIAAYSIAAGAVLSLGRSLFASP